VTISLPVTGVDERIWVRAGAVSRVVTTRGCALSEISLRLIESAVDLGPVLLLAGEYEEWARGRVLAEYGIEMEFASADSLFRDLDGFRGGRARLYLAQVDGEPAGLGGLKPLSTDQAEIKRMYVRPSSRGRGVGRAILQQLIDDARTLGFSHVCLDSAGFMHEAQALYRRFGFVPSNPHAGWEFESVAAMREVAVFMTLDLKSQ
jgi:GNAT superfamily N-acetyltransferase